MFQRQWRIKKLPNVEDDANQDEGREQQSENAVANKSKANALNEPAPIIDVTHLCHDLRKNEVMYACRRESSEKASRSLNDSSQGLLTESLRM